MVTTNFELALVRLGKSFTPHKPINVPEFFAGRLDLLYTAIDAVNSEGLHVILYGDRGIGKTSVARVLAHNAQDPETENGRRALFVSCTSSDDYASIWKKASQEVLIAQRQIGFAQLNASIVTGRTDMRGALDDPNDVRFFVQSLPNPTVIVIDEFDRVPFGNNARRLMADTIKLFSDTDVKSTIVVVGVAESIGELMGEHQSIIRNLAQIPVDSMTIDELGEIIQKGFSRAGLGWTDGLDRRIAALSQGYPSYTHLLGLWAGRRAAESGQAFVADDHVDRAVADALVNATGGAQYEYETAVATSQPGTLFKDVLLACALANKDSLGRFSAVDVREPLREILGRAELSTVGFQGHLAQFCEEDRGSILRRTGRRRAYRWRFSNPQLIPYIILRGIVEGDVEVPPD